MQEELRIFLLFFLKAFTWFLKLRSMFYISSAFMALNFLSDFCFPPNDILGTSSEISEVKDKGKPEPPVFVKMFCVIHPGLFDSRTG